MSMKEHKTHADKMKRTRLDLSADLMSHTALHMSKAKNAMEAEMVIVVLEEQLEHLKQTAHAVFGKVK